MSIKMLHVDIDRCIGCRACEVACAREHDGFSHIFITSLEDHYSVPLCCLQCEKSPCAEVCPTKALENTSHNAVIVHQVRCIGCRLCTLVCPLGVIHLDEKNTVLKCDKCIHRLQQKKDPVCVLTCPTKALNFGTPEQIMGQRRKSGARARAFPSKTTKFKRLSKK